MTFQSNGETVETGGREDRLLPWGRVRDIAGISRTTAWRMQQTGDFPMPVPVSPGRVAWWESELTAWKGARGAAKPLAPPSRPRLPGMPRRSQRRAAVQLSNALDGQEDLPIAPTLTTPVAEAALRSPGRKRGARAVSANQLDFDF